MKASIEKVSGLDGDFVQVMIPDGLITSITVWTPAQWEAVKAAILEEVPAMAIVPPIPPVYVNGEQIGAKTLLYMQTGEPTHAVADQLFINGEEIPLVSLWERFSLNVKADGIHIKLPPLIARLVQLAWPYVEDAG